MSSYITTDQYFAQCGPAFGGVDPTVLAGYITDASAEADGYISKRYQLPLIVPIDPQLQRQVLVLTQWRVATQIGFRPGSGQNEVIQFMYEKAIEWLLRVSRGDAVINSLDSTPDVDEEGSQSASDKKMSFRTFTGKRHCDE